MFLVFSFALLFFLKERKSISFLFFFSSIGFILFLLYLNSNITSYICLLLVLLLIALFKIKKKYVYYFLIISSLLALVLYIGFKKDIKEALHFDPAVSYWETPKYRILRFFHEGDPTRKQTWKYSTSIIKDNIYFGVGIGDFVDELQTKRDKNTYAYINKLDAHNQYLNLAGKTGIIGLIIFISIILNNIIIARKNNSFIFYSFILITSTSFFTDSILSRQWGLIFFCIFNYILYEYTNCSKEKVRL